MDKKEVYICHQQCDLQEDEIDLKELFKIIWNYKKFIIFLVSFITLLSIIFVYLTKPIYQIENFLEIGYYNSNSNSNSKEYFIDPNNALILIQNEFTKKDQLPNLKNIAFKKKTKILDIKIDAYSNQEAKKYLEKIISFLIKKENKKLTILMKNNNLKIKNLLDYKIVLEKQLKDFNKQLKSQTNPLIYQALIENINKLNDKIFNTNSQIEDLKMQISPLNITRTHIIGKIIENKYPIKPKKKLIVIVAFITSLILAIFLVFFIEFIKSFKEEEK